MQHRLKPAPGTARTRIIAPELLKQLLVAVHDPIATLDAGLAQGNLGAVSRCAQKQGSDSRSFLFFFAIQPPGKGERKNLFPP